MRFVGEAVAVVVAETKAAAVDAVELVEVDYDPLPAVVDPEAALEPGAPLQFPELGTNLAAGDRAPPTPTRSPTPRSSSAPGWSTSGWPCVPMEGNAIAVRPVADGDGARPDDLGVHPDAARLPQPGRRAVRAGRRSGSG